MNWSEVKSKIENEIIAGETEILKCDGVKKRPVLSNKNSKIRMKTGDGKNSQKTITYEMIKYAFEWISKNKPFFFKDFVKKFEKEKNDGDCKFSMTGGVLVELEFAKLIPKSKGIKCHYIRNY